MTISQLHTDLEDHFQLFERVPFKAAWRRRDTRSCFVWIALCLIALLWALNSITRVHAFPLHTYFISHNANHHDLRGTYGVEGKVFLDSARWMSESDRGSRLSKSLASFRIVSDDEEKALSLTFL